ncbi:MAG: type II secretion system GspH family protein [Lachnospiraceae bacterium]|nr:type II secretion system GspH family protein [Lachnospiraceae bacterium]
MTDRRMKKCNIAEDNRGFSLVELIVCVAILAIAIIPLYQSMTLSARTNAKAQSMQNVTSLGELVMEEIKTSSIFDLQVKYNGTAVIPGTSEVKPIVTSLTDKDAGFFETTPPPSTEAEWIALYTAQIGKAKAAADLESTTSGITGTELLTGKVDDSDDPKKPFYVLYKKDAVSTQGEKFAVLATLRTSSYMNAKNDTASDANSLKLPEIDEIDALSQAVITSKEFSRYDEAARDYFRQNGDHYDASKNIKCKKISIEKTDNVSHDLISVKCRVIYYDYNPDPHLSETGSTYSRDLFAGTFSAPDDGSTTIASNIYLFYKKPAEVLPGGELISITDSTSNATHKVYFVMQSDTALSIDGTGITVDYGGMTLDETTDLDVDGNMKNGDFEIITNLQHKDAENNTVKGHIYKEESGIRIYDVAVHLFKQNPDGTIGDYVTSVDSTKEAND